MISLHTSETKIAPVTSTNKPARTPKLTAQWLMVDGKLTCQWVSAID